jgi:hypothetical protein
VDADKLPIRLGGTCECVGGCKFSDVGAWQAEAVRDGAAENGVVEKDLIA